MAGNSDDGPSRADPWTGGESAMTIDELARQARLPVRTIREYHTMRLLPPPQRRGRVGYYGARHVQRLALIGRLQRRGYSLAGIRDLLRAWTDGSDLTALLGVEPRQDPLDEMPLRLAGADLLARAPALAGSALDRACAIGLVRPDGEGFLVRSPALVAFVSDGTAAGMPVDDMLDIADAVIRQLTGLADLIAGAIAGRLPALPAGRDAGSLAQLLQRSRLLLLQGAASTLADRLGEALERRAAGTGGGALLAALDQVRVGAVADAAGNVSATGRAAR